MNLCCFDLNKLYKEKKLRIRYEVYSRGISLQLPGGAEYQRLFYCFCCGKKLPKNLRETWYSVLTEEYHIEDPWEAFYEGTLPPEFMTDEWWKKRGV
jgi:hypothetical protein